MGIVGLLWETLISKKQQKRRTWESWFTSLWKSPNNVLQLVRKGTKPWEWSKEISHSGAERSSLNSSNPWWDHTFDYAMQAWSPYMEKDKKIIEKVQARATKLIPNLKNLPYEDRLNRLNLTTLERRRQRGILSRYIASWAKSTRLILIQCSRRLYTLEPEDTSRSLQRPDQETRHQKTFQ